MLWLADVLIGTKSQQWDERYRAREVVAKESKRSGWKRISGFVRRGLVRVSEWLEHRRTIRALNQLSDHLLRDVGIERADIAEYVRNNNQVTLTESISPREASAEHSNLGVGPSGGLTGTPLVQQCVVRSQALSCANDAIKRVA